MRVMHAYTQTRTLNTQNNLEKNFHNCLSNFFILGTIMKHNLIGYFGKIVTASVYKTLSNAMA